MRTWTMLVLLTGLFVAGCAGGMGGSVASDQDQPASCKEGGDAQQRLKDLEQKTQAETGMTPQQQQMFMQQMMQGGGGMMGGMGGGMMPHGQMPMMQPGMRQPGAMPGIMPGMAPSRNMPRQPGEMTPQEEQDFLKKIEQLQQQQQSTTPAK